MPDEPQTTTLAPVEWDEQGSHPADTSTFGQSGDPPVFIVYVDNTPEMNKALYFACRRSRQLKGRVALATVIEPIGHSQWLSVANMMLKDARVNAESRLHAVAGKVLEWTDGSQPLFLIGQGSPASTLLKLVNESILVSILVMAVSADPDRPNTLLSQLTGKAALELHKPLLIIPRSMTYDDIEALT